MGWTDYKDDETVLKEIKRGKIRNIRYMKDVSLISTLTDDDIAEALSNIESRFFIINYEEMCVLFRHANTGEKAMGVIIDRFPALLAHEDIKPKMTSKTKRLLLDDFCNNPVKYFEKGNKCGYIWITLEMNEDMWKEVIDTLKKPGAPDFSHVFTKHLSQREISSDIVVEYTIEKSYCNTGFPINAELTKKYFDLWINKKMDAKGYFSEVLALSEDRSLALKAHPEIYPYIKYPTAADAKIIIDINPKNLSLVKKQSEKLCLMALKKDKGVFKYVKNPTKRILEFMGMDTKKASRYAKYSEKQYLITCKTDVADEGDIIYIGIVPGKEMPDFMSQKIERYGFSGNLDCDDGIHYVEDFMKAQAITDDELNVLKKFGILDLNTGFFCFDDGDDE